MNYKQHKVQLEEKGYSILENLYSDSEIDKLITCINNVENTGSSFLKTKDLLAIRQLLINVPDLADLLFNAELKSLLSCFFEDHYFLSKAIYFDKPSASNWFVPYHQDLSISVAEKTDVKDFKNWTFKKGQYGVQPPLHVLQNTVTVRIHLDDTDENNGALKVIPSSHSNGVVRNDTANYITDNEQVCKVKKGGVMLMKPLTLHASGRSTNTKKRRVIHLEFNNQNLPGSLEWLERLDIA